MEKLRTFTKDVGITRTSLNMKAARKQTCDVGESRAGPFFPRFIKIWDVFDSRQRQFHTWSDCRELWRQVPRTELEPLLAYLYDKFCTFGYVGLRHRDGFI